MQNQILSETMPVPSDGTQGKNQNSAWKCAGVSVAYSAETGSETWKTSLCKRSKHGFGKGTISQVQGDAVTDKLSPVP